MSMHARERWALEEIDWTLLRLGLSDRGWDRDRVRKVESSTSWRAFHRAVRRGTPEEWVEALRGKSLESMLQVYRTMRDWNLVEGQANPISVEVTESVLELMERRAGIRLGVNHGGRAEIYAPPIMPLILWAAGTPESNRWNAVERAAAERKAELRGWLASRREHAWMSRSEWRERERRRRAEERQQADVTARAAKDRRKAADALARAEAAARAERKLARATELLPNAVRRGDVKAVDALRLRGGDITMKLPDGRSLVELAREHGRSGVVEYLEGVLVQE